ncbi:MAG: hypothetical protein JSU85_01825, partial [Candidatus Zixiibacteriota bacterium]
MFEFIPDYTQAGSDTVRFIASDGIAADTQLVDITVNNTNLAPVLDTIPSPQIVAEGSLLQVSVASSDPDGTIPILTAENLPPNAVFADSGNGAGLFEFAPDYNQAGTHQVLFIASDGDLADSQYVNIDVSNTDRAPALDPITPPAVIEGDHLDLRVTASDPDGDTITLIAEFTSANMAFADSSGGVGGLTFDPDYTQAGVHPVRFIAQSNALADTQLVDITVTDVDLPPELALISPQSVAEGDHLDLRVTAYDPDGDIITLLAEFTSANMAFVDSTGGVGGLTFDPDYTQAGLHQVRFIAQSNTLADTQLVDITVTEVDLAPALASIPPQSINEGGHLEFQVTATDPDGDSIALTAELLILNMAFVDSTGGVGGFTFDPDSTQSGFYQVRFIASSNSLADTQLVDITVGNVDLPPSFDPITPPAVAEGDHLDLRVTAYDPDGDTITLTSEFTSANMAFVDSTGGVGGLTFDPDYTQAGVHQVRFIAASNVLADTQLVDITVTNVNLPPVLDFIVTPQAVAEGSMLQFAVTASDPDGAIPALVALDIPPNANFVDSLNGLGLFTFNPDYAQADDYQVLFIASDGNLADSQYVDITVTNVNRTPVLDLISSPQSVNENETLYLRVTASDPDGNIPLLSAFNIPINSSFVDSANGAGGFVFTPDYTQAAIYQVSFVASDGALADSQMVNVIVANVNAPPVITVVGPQTVTEGNPLLFTVSATDIDGTTPALSYFNGPVNSSFEDSLNGVGLFRFYPDFTQSGTYDVGFIAYDGALADTDYVNITVLEIGNQAPILSPIGSRTIGEGETLLVAVSAVDPDSSIPQLLTGTLPPNAVFEDSLNGRGLFTFMPDYTQSGIDTVLFIATDGALSDSEYVQLTITEAGNQYPVLDSIGSQTVDEGNSLILTITSSDPDGSIPALSALNLPSGAGFIDNGDGTGDFSYYPGFFDEGLYTVIFIASDGVLADTEHVDITVNDTPRPPVWNSIADRAVFEGQTISFVVQATDPDLTIPALSVETLAENWAFTDSLNGKGLFTFSPDYTQAGQYTLTFIASDGTLSDSEFVEIFVFEAGNQPPEIDSIGPQTVIEGEHLEILITASDPEGIIPALQSFNRPANSTFTDYGNGSGLFTFDPSFTQAGVYNVLFRAFDGELYDSLWVEITVIDFGFPPTLDPIGPRSVTEGEILYVSVSASDPDSTIPQLLAEQLPANAAFVDSLNGTGLLTFIPDYTQAGIDTVLFIATDGALSDSEYVEITVIEAGNQPPALAPIDPQTVDEGSLLQFVVSASDPDSTIPVLSAE